MSKTTKKNKANKHIGPKVKVWKKILVGFMSVTMFAGNVSGLTIEAFAADDEVVEEAAAYDEMSADFSGEEAGESYSEGGGEQYGEAPAEEYAVEDVSEEESVAEEAEAYEEQEYVPLEEVELDEEIKYTVNYYDPDGALISTVEFYQGEQLTLPENTDKYVWKNAAGTVYTAGIIVSADVDLYASIPETKEEAVEISVKAVCVDEAGNSIASDKIALDEISSMASLEKETANILIPNINEYEYKEARLLGTVISKVRPDEESGLVYTIDGSNWNAFEDGAEVQLIYISLAEELEKEELEQTEVTLEASVVQKATRPVLSKTVNMSYTITVTNTSKVDAKGVTVKSEIPSIITINSGLVEDQIDIPAGQTVTLSLSGVINQNTNDVDSLSGRFYVNGQKVDDVSFTGEGRLVAADANGEGPTYLSTNIDGMTVSVSAADGSVIPAGTKLNVTRVGLSGIDSIESAQDIDIAEAVAYDVTLTIDGEEVQPDGSVVVSFYDLPFAVEEGESVGVAHMGDGGSVEGIASGSGDAVSIEADHFSVYIIFKTYKYIASGNVLDEDGNALAAFDFGVFAGNIKGSAGHQNISFVASNVNGQVISGLNNGGAVESDQKIVYVQHISDGMNLQDALANYNGNASMKYVFGPNVKILRDGNTIYAEEEIDGATVKIALYRGNDSYNTNKVLTKIYSTDEEYIDIQKELDNAAKYSRGIYNAEAEAIRVEADNQGNNGKFTLDTTAETFTDKCVFSMTGEQLSSCTSGITLNTRNDQSVIINVVCDSDTYEFRTNINFNGMGGSAEGSALKNINVIWNFVDSEGNPYTGTIRFTNTFKGSILAPMATVEAHQVDGSIIAKDVYLTGENHVSTQTTVSYTVYKVWSDSKEQTVNVDLYRQLRDANGNFLDGGSIDRAAAGSSSNYEYIASACLAPGGNFTHTFTGLDAVDEYGNNCSYFVVERDVPAGYTAIYQDHTIINSTTQAIPVTIAISGTKTVNGREPEAGEVFTFELYDYTSGNTWGGSPRFSVTNTGSSFTFPEMTFDGTGWTGNTNNEPCYYYKVVEKQENRAGYIFDKTQYIVKVRLRNEDGRWVPEVKYFRYGGDEFLDCKGDTQDNENGGREGSLTFNNVKDDVQPAEYTFQATKIMDGEWPEGATFTFRLEAIGSGSSDQGSNDITGNGEFMPALTEVTVTKDNPVANFGTVVFPADTTTGWGSGSYANTQCQCYMYKMYEVKGDVPGVTYSDKVQYIKIWHNTTHVNGLPTRTWLEVNGSTDNKVCGGTLGDITFVNSCVPEYTQVYVNKVWDDSDNTDGFRPEQVTVELLADGVSTGKTAVLNAGNNWYHTFTELPKYSSGTTPIVYSISEVSVSGYSSEITGGVDADGNGYSYTVTNSHTVENVSVSGSKTWVDGDDQDGARPSSIKINLLADGVVKETKTVTAADGWAWTFDNLPKYVGGKEVAYSITEDAVTAYATTINGYNVTNTHTPTPIVISGSKTWDDKDNQDGKRPESITVNLLKNGSSYKSVEVTAANNWSYSFTGLPKYEDGNEIVYSISEVSVDGYESSVSGYDITNKYTPSTIDISGTKTWNDDNNRDGKRPASITIRLKKNGVNYLSKTVTAADGWTYSFENLPEYEAGTKIEYTISEDTVSDYSTEISGYDVTNTYTPGKININGVKTWVDNDDQDGIRPDSITVNLYANGTKVDSTTATAANGWAYSFVDLPEYQTGSVGSKIVYTIDEEAVTGYTKSISADCTSIINTHTTEKISVSGSKTWNDGDNQDNIRPSSITINLLANGEKVDSKEVTASENWTWTFIDLPKNKDGVAITYTITEEEVEGYESTIDGYNVTNTHTPEVTEVSGSKTWEDGDDQDGKRPESITINLMKGAEQIDSKTVTADDDWSWTFDELPKYENGSEITYTIVEEEVEGYSTSYDGYNVTNTYTPGKVTVAGSKTWEDGENQDGLRPDTITIRLLADGVEVDSMVVSPHEDGTWTWEFADLDEYNAGKKIVYTITEDTVESYNSEISGYNVVNTHTPEDRDIEITKTWVDNGDQDGIRPESITVRLYADGVEKEVATISGDSTTDTWIYTFTGLPVYENGEEIVYTVTEDSVTGYTSEVSDFTITNTHETTKIAISGTKVWDDASNQDGKRPESITLKLYAGETLKDTTTVSGDGDEWSFTFEDLDKCADGSDIVYKIVEDEVTDYSTEYSGMTTTEAGYSCTVTNSYTPGKTSVSGSKTWNDKDNQDGKRPASITIRLMNGTTEVASKTVSEADGWAWDFEDLDLMAGGQKIIYTIVEDEVAEYTTSVNGYNVTNSYEPKTTEVSGTKTWIDADNQDGKRPESITINLLANGDIIDSKVVKEDSGWSWTFDNLPTYSNGNEITYTISEEKVDGYDSQINGYDVINTHEVELIDIEGTKTWVDDNNQDGIRPDSITINLMNGEEIVATVEVEANESGVWSYEFKDLPKYANGEEITYTVQEVSVEGYTSTIDGYNITNTHEPKKISVKGNKVWDDKENQDGIRPESIMIQLYADGEPLGDAFSVSSTDGWSWVKEDLPMYKDNGTAIQYSYKEVFADGAASVEGYEAPVYSDNGGYSYTITNKHEPETTSVTVNKTWRGTASVDSIEISVGRIVDGVFTATKTGTISAASGWTTTIDELPKMDAGEEIIYYVTEGTSDKYVQVDSSDAVLTGPTVVEGGTAELYNIGTTEFTVEKQWICNNDNLSSAWASIVDSVDISLYDETGALVTTDAYGNELSNPVSVSAAAGWTYTWKDLAGNHTYTAKENLSSQLSQYFNKANNGEPTIIAGNTPNYLIIQNVVDPLELTVNKSWLGDEAGTTHEDVNVKIFSSVDLKNTASSVFDRIKAVLGGDASGWYEYSTVTLSASNGWTSKVEDLPRWVLVGSEVVEVSYAVEELDSPSGYTSVTNVDMASGTASVINTAKSVVAGFKVWDDNQNALGLRPSADDFAANIVLYKDGAQFLTGTDTEHFAWISTEGDSWEFQFKDLDAGSYTIGELNVVPGYSAGTVSDRTITNKIDFTEVSVTKLWDDSDNVYSSRPSTVSFRLLANGVAADITGVDTVVTLGNISGEKYTWTNLPTQDGNGTSIIYSVEEVEIPEGYTASMTNTGNAYTVTNRYRPKTTNISVYKVWDDNNNEDRIRPTSIEVALTRNGVDYEVVTLNRGNGWSYTWNNMPLVIDDGIGTEATYAVREVSQILGYAVTVTNSGEVYTITNYHRGSNPPGDNPPGDNPPGDNPPGDNPPGDNPPGDNPPGDNPPENPTPEDNSPLNDTPYTIPDEPVPLAGISDVLGVRKAPADSVLGARRSPKTGDTSNAGAFVAAMASAGAMMGAWFAMRRKKSK